MICVVLYQNYKSSYQNYTILSKQKETGLKLLNPAYLLFSSLDRNLHLNRSHLGRHCNHRHHNQSNYLLQESIHPSIDLTGEFCYNHLVYN